MWNMEYGNKQVVKGIKDRRQKTEDRMDVEYHRMEDRRQKTEDGIDAKTSQSLKRSNNRTNKK